MSTFTGSPERTLLLSLLAQAMRDLRASDPQIQGDAARFFDKGECLWLCDMLAMDIQAVQGRARAILAQQAEVPAPLE